MSNVYIDCVLYYCPECDEEYMLTELDEESIEEKRCPICNCLLDEV